SDYARLSLLCSPHAAPTEASTLSLHDALPISTPPPSKCSWTATNPPTPKPPIPSGGKSGSPTGGTRSRSPSTSRPPPTESPTEPSSPQPTTTRLPSSGPCQPER